MPEAYGAQFNWGEALKSGRIVDSFCQALRVVKVTLDGGAKTVEPVITQRKPELQPAKTPREFDGLLEECEAFDRIVAELLRVGAGIEKGTACDLGVAVKQAATIRRPGPAACPAWYLAYSRKPASAPIPAIARKVKPVTSSQS